MLAGFLALVCGSALITAQAGTTRSGGGHGMVNARNFSASRHLGGRNLIGHFGGLSQAKSYFKKAFADFKAQHSLNSLFTQTHSNYSISHTIDSTSHSTSIVNTTNGNSFQSEGKHGVNSYGFQQHVRTASANINGHTFDTEKTFSTGSVNEQKQIYSRDITTKFGNTSGESVFRGRKTNVSKSETTSQFNHSTYTQERSATGNGKYYTKSTTITPGADNPIEHKSLIED